MEIPAEIRFFNNFYYSSTIKFLFKKEFNLGYNKEVLSYSFYTVNVYVDIKEDVEIINIILKIKDNDDLIKNFLLKLVESGYYGFNMGFTTIPPNRNYIGNTDIIIPIFINKKDIDGSLYKDRETAGRPVVQMSDKFLEENVLLCGSILKISKLRLKS